MPAVAARDRDRGAPPARAPDFIDDMTSGRSARIVGPMLPTSPVTTATRTVKTATRKSIGGIFASAGGSTIHASVMLPHEAMSIATTAAQSDNTSDSSIGSMIKRDRDTPSATRTASLALLLHPAHEQEIRDVRARDEQDDRDDSAESRRDRDFGLWFDRRTERREDRTGQDRCRVRAHAHVRDLAATKRRGRNGGDPRIGHSRRDTPNRSHDGAVAPMLIPRNIEFPVGWILRERQPDVDRIEIDPRETIGHHADHRDLRAPRSTRRARESMGRRRTRSARADIRSPRRPLRSPSDLRRP